MFLPKPKVGTIYIGSVFHIERRPIVYKHVEICVCSVSSIVAVAPRRRIWYQY